jgi:hypothetical protein
MSTPLPLETQTLYAELLEHLVGVHAERSIGRLAGSFAEKTIKGESYLYWQASQPGGRTKQFYLGRRTPAMEGLRQRFERAHADIQPDLARVKRLSAQLRAGGANVTDSASARVVRALAGSGLFDAGAVLVGTHAFAMLGNLLGVRWVSASLRTQDIDLAAASDADIDVAVPELETDVPSVLDSLEMGFLPVPPLNPKQPSTSFKVRGQSLRVDLLCPKRGSNDKPVVIRRFNAAAQPLDYLEYLIETPERAVVVNGGADLVNVPAPARFAFHKLMVATLRPATFQTKAEKDVAQACEVLDVLADNRPGDLAIAWDSLLAKGIRWDKVARRGLALLRQRRPDLHRRILALVEPATPPASPRKKR